MIKVLKLGNVKRKPSYYKLVCPHCSSELVCELDDIWMDTPGSNIGRVTCPVCRTKFNFIITDSRDNDESAVVIEINPFWSYHNAEKVDKEVYENAHTDVSKSGLQALIDEKEAEEKENAKLKSIGYDI